MKALVGYKLRNILHEIKKKFDKELRFPVTKGDHTLETYSPPPAIFREYATHILTLPK
jgi:hypothetical protein